MSLIEGSINQGYSVAWGSDVSEKGFNWTKGIAVVPDADLKSMDGTEQARWVALTEKEKQAALYKLDKPGTEKTITQENRQAAFDNYETTDDHGMVLEGLATDQDGNKYFKVKNSWGTDQVYKGYFYASYPFVAYKTINVLVNKNVVPKALRDKLGIK
jgi:bleomycin hydrolase